MKDEHKKMSIKSKIFYIIFFLLIVISIGTTFLKYLVYKDYQILAEVSCNPQAEKCFIKTCDPVDDSTCPINESDRTAYYKLISKNASSIYICENTFKKIGCFDELSCIQNEKNCSYTYCDSVNLAEGEQCSQ
jgi:hypothetical protein